MAEITKLLEILLEGNAREDLDRNLRSDSIAPGLLRFDAILRCGTADVGDGRLGLESWSDAQIDAVVAIARVIVKACVSATVETVGTAVLGVLEGAIEFCVCGLERWEFDGEDLHLQNDMVQLLEMALVDDTFVEPSSDSEDHSLLDHIGSLPDVSNEVEHVELRSRNCDPQGVITLKDKKTTDRVVITTTSADPISCPTSQFPNSTISLSKHIGVLHVKCLPRLLWVSKKFLQLPSSLTDASKNSVFTQRSSFILRILKLLGNVSKDVPVVQLDTDLLTAVTCYADDLLALFRHEFEFIFREAAVITETFECHLLLLLEELMHLVQVVFSNGNIFQNVQTCVVAKMLGIFDVQLWRYNRSSSTLKPPSIYCPKVIIYLVKLMRDVKMQTTQTLDWKGNFEIDPCSYLSGSETNPPSWAVGSKTVFLLKKYLPEEHLRLLFPPSKEWVDDFINLAFFLHSEGVKLKSKVEKLRSSHAKSVAVLDLDSTTSHEDEALFGNLFSESNRSCGSNDSRQDQPEVGSTTASNICHMFINATAELLSFMKLCTFCPEWSASVYEDACKKVTENHISTLISILSCQSVLVDEKICESNTTPSEKTSRNISDICFGLLHNLLVWRSLSPTNEQHLVDEILKVENGKYVYNSYTLTLLAHVLFSRSDLTGSQLTMKIYKSFVDFIVRKCKDNNQCYADFKEFLDSLPCTFHMEILLMAFHLSSESEKASLASYVFLSLKSLDAPVVDLNAHQLSCWGLLVSRLILLVQHFLTYPSTSPVWLLLRLRAILKEAPPVDSLMDPSGDHLGSWTSNVLVNLMADSVKELPIARGLLSQLVDFSLLSSTAHKDDISNQILGLNSMELLAIFLRILGYWEGRIAEVVEDLVVERYIFMLCWDTASVFSCDVSDSFMLHFDFQKLDSMSTNVFFLFGRCLRSNSMITHDSNPSAMIPKFLEQLSSAGMLEQGQDVLKNAACLSLLLSLLQSGIWLYSVKSDGNEARPYWVEHSSKKNQFLFVAGNTLEMIFKGNRVGWLVSALLCCLRMSMQRFQEAFLDDFGDRQCHGCNFSPYLLLKHTMFDRSKQDELLGKSTADYSRLESIFGVLSKLNDITKAGNAVPLILRSSLHGFPLNQEISSAILLSCILTIHDIICTLDGLFKLQNVREDMNIENESIVSLLDLVMTVQSDRVFQVVHGKCADIFCSLVAPSKAKLDYGYLFQLKHIETFLAHLNSEGTTDHTIQEMLVSSIIDAIEALKKDTSKVEIFKFYLGAEGSREQDELFGSQHGNLLILIDALDRCHSEAINVKVFNLFVDVLENLPCPGLREKVLERFLSMNLPAFSVWLEFRLLGSTSESSNDVPTTKGSPLSLRESTMNFITCLLSHPGETLSQEFRCHLVEGMLNILDKAFICYDINIAKAYFNFVLQLLNGRSMLKQLLQRAVLLLQNLAGNETSLHALEFLAGFLCNAMGDHGTRNTSDELREKLSAGCTVESIVPRQVNSRKNTETLVLAAGEEATSTSIDCDATSVDDDEDDGTSDGEVASIDKDEEESNGDKALASRVCTFTSSGSNFMEQHWYFCYTCDLTVSKGCCSVCAKVCHRGHRVVYSRSSRFFCDCGAGGVRGSSCQCLKPRKFSSSSNSAPVHSSSGLQVLMPFSEDGDQIVDSDSDLDDIFAEADSAFQLSFPKEVQSELPVLLEDLHIEDKVLQVCEKLLPKVISRRDSNISAEKKVILRGDKVLSFNVDIFRLKKAYKSGSLDLKIRAEYPNSRELKLHLTNGSFTKSLLSVSTRGRLAAGEGDKVSIFDVGQLIGQSTIAPVTADKSNIKPLSKNMVRFEIVHLMFNPLVENYLVVAGYEECQVLTINPRGEVTDRLAIELALQGAYIRRVDWVPGSQVQLLVVTNMFVKIYDLSQDNISPMHYFTLADDLIVDATLVTAPMGRVFLLVFSELGNLFRLEVLLKGDVGAKLLKDIVQIPKKDVHAKGQSLYFSPSHRLLFLSYQDGMTCIGRLDADASSITEMSTLYDSDQDAKPRPAALHHWKDLLVDSGVFTCLSSIKQNAALAVSLGTHELFAQNMRYVGGSSLALVGVAAYKPLSKDKAHCLVLHEDGSLQIYSYTPSGAEATSNVNSNQAKKIGVGILSNKAYAEMKPEFPLDFFERTICITADIGLSSEAIKNSDSEGIKLRLASDDGFIESSSPAGFKVTIFNSNPDIVMVGIRLQVGNTSASHIPSEVAIFQRFIKLDEGMRSWYDIPFTTAESLLADEEFTISIGPTFNGSTSPRIDSLEVYGRAKDEFGWKEKMDAILDMEADVLLSNSVPVGLKKQHRIAKVSSLEEQVLAHMLKLLSRFYSLCKRQSYSEAEEATAELIKLKCSKMLETIFQSDREPLLRFAACHVLQSLFSKRETYYHVKDTMCLFGVLNSAPMLSSRVGCGNGATGWVVKEFIAKTRAVSKIALVRRTNVASFLEAQGSVLVDGLMQVFWEIMNVEQPDTQTINNIVVPCVELIYSYAECLALRGPDTCGHSVEPAVKLFKELLFAPYESVQTSSSLAISSRLLQVPFPKQRMLGTDENSENQASTHVHTDVTGTTGRNAPSVIEEDSTTSSVQYCCDGCSTVPILRRRWHCNVCPDFDLCEACYEVMGADRLPPPHSKDHRMSAIPIDIDSVGGDSNEIQFSMDELNGVNLGHISSNIRSQTSPSPGHVLESNDAVEDSTVTDQRIVSISASKRAVNSLLLRQLITDLNGWMENTSGVRAIPLMQLFYRLSSAVGGPFMDSSKPEALDLERFVKWFLDEINLKKPFAAQSRTFFGETSILVFMFFTLMLRNWHHPGSESSHSKSASGVDVQDKGFVSIPPSFSSAASSSNNSDRNEFASQLVRACSCLRQQVLVNYLMDILLQLVPHFKYPPMNSESGLPSNSGCGSLLTVRRELPAGNFSPFFSDSYAKAHRSDLFMDYHKLLLENTFRLVYSLVRPEKQDKSVEKEKICKNSAGKDLKLDGYQDVLCNYISNPNTIFVRRYARRLFLHLCGSKHNYYSVRDSWQLANEVKKLRKLVNKSGGFCSPVPYERSVKLVKCLSTMAEIAGARPRNWQKYCSKHGDVLSFLMEGIFYFGEESVVQTLKLLNLAFYPGKDMMFSILKPDTCDTAANSSGKSGSQAVDSKKKKKGEDGSESSGEKCLDMEQAVEVFSLKNGTVLMHFVDTFLLEWNSSSVRMEAKSVLYGAWHHGKQAFKEALLTALLQKIKFLPMYGQNIVECTELLTLFIGKAFEGRKQQEIDLINHCLTSDVIKCIFETFHNQNELLANHPNSRIYSTLSSLVEFDGYYLESEPCVACSCPEVPYSRMKLEALKFETKFTDNRIIVKCTGSYTIQSVIMNVHDARKSKSVKVLNLYYNNRPVVDLSELKNNWSLWKRAKSCHLTFNQTELKVDFPIPITACNFMIELDSFYENLQASSLESLQCPRCSRSVTDKHGICSNCHENAYQCRQCRNINYENLDSFLCNECGYSKYGRFEFNFMARPSFLFDSMENDEDMKKGLAAIEAESENAHRRYQQLMGFKKPLLKLVSSIGEHEIDSQQKDTVQQMMVSLPGPSCKINRKIALLGVLYGEKCKAAFDSVSKSVQTLQGLRRVLTNYLQQSRSGEATSSRFATPRLSNNCYGCATTFVSQCMELLQILSKHPSCKKQLIFDGILVELFENNIHQGPKAARIQARAVLCAFSEGDSNALAKLNSLIHKKVMYCLEHHRSMDIAQATREELCLLSEACAVVDEFWEARLRVAFQLLFASIKLGAKNPSISEHIILPCLRIISQACTPPKSEPLEKDQGAGKPVSALSSKNDDFSNSPLSSTGPVDGGKSFSDSKNMDVGQKGQEISLLSYAEWEKGASYIDFVRRQYKISQAVKSVSQRSHQGAHRNDYLALKYGLRWKRICLKRTVKNDFSTFELGSWVSELILSACSQSIRAEVCSLVSLLCPQKSFRRFQLMNLLMLLLPATLSAGESAAEYFELFFKMIDSETALLFLTAKGCLATVCRLITQEVGHIESQERSLNIDISQGFILHKLVELLSKFLEVPNIRSRFMREDLLSDVLESLLIIRGLIVQKTKLISDCNKLLKDLLDSLLVESTENKKKFIRACISGLQMHGKEKKGRTCLFILEQLCNLICPSKPEPVYLLILNKAHTQEEFIRGSMTKNPYSSTEIGPLMRDVKNKICHQLDLLGLVDDDYGMELLVAGNIISLDLSISQVYEQVWKKSQRQMQSTLASAAVLASGGSATARDCPPMTITYRLQGLDGEATEPMIKELEEEREESQDPEVEFAIAGSVQEFGGLEVILSMIQHLRDYELKSNQEELASVLNLLMYCCKIRENRRALLRFGALGLLLETARRAFSVDAMEPAEGILLIVESLTMEANESDFGVNQNVLTVGNEEAGAGEQAKKIVLMFLERLCYTPGLKKSNKQQRNNEMVARILPYLTYGEPAAMETLIEHFVPYLHDWVAYDHLQKKYQENVKDEAISQQAGKQRSEVENFVRVSESLDTSFCGEKLKDIILEKGITAVAVRHLRESFTFDGQVGSKTSMEWQNRLTLPSVPVILSMLRGLSRAHFATQKYIEEGGVLPLLHALEGVSGENGIGARAENLLDTLSDKDNNGDGFLREKVNALRHATRNEMRQRALKKREELLQGLGMRQELASDGGERIIVAQPVIEGLEDVEEEKDGLACMVCREGYTLRPSDILGVYSFSKRVNLGAGSSGSSRGECVYTTVSHFNIIHFQCHQEAKRADAALKNPKKEWEGATLRNNETLCNCIFPLKGPSVPLSQYVRYVDQYWENLNALGRADGSRLRLLTYDIVLMLARFATGASFSTDSKGGGKESNARFLPFMIQMACHLLDQGNSSQPRRSMARSISSYLSASSVALDSPSRSPSGLSIGRSSSGSSDDTVQFMMVNSLLSESYDEWSRHLPVFLQRSIFHSYMQHTRGRSTLRISSDPGASVVKSSDSQPSDDSKLFSIIQPMLIYTGLIEQLQRFFKYSSKSSKAAGTKVSEADKAASSSSGLESWEILMTEKLVNMKEMVGFSKDLLSWLEDMTTAVDLQEAFDTMGALGAVLSGGFSRCEDFVQAAIDSGKA